MESFATPYPVLFYDGDQEHDKGHVGVHSVLTFKRFQALMSQKTGYPANQLAAVFVCRRTLKDSEKRQKLPINENTNFNIILNQHNPSRERDCHFLVSMKKSKKERKGIRKRNAEAENAEDEDSTSSRGDLSPSDERPKTGSIDIFSPEATSPPNFLQRPSFPSVPPGIPHPTHQKLGNCSPQPNVSPGPGPSDFSVERTPRRREGMGKNGFASPLTGWRGNGVSSHRVEGFAVQPATAGKTEIHAASLTQSLNSQVLQRDETGNFEKHTTPSRSMSPVIEEGSVEHQPEKANENILLPDQDQDQGKIHHHQLPGVEFCHHDRSNDAIPHCDGLEPQTSVFPRDGGAPVGSPSIMHTNSFSTCGDSSRPMASNVATESGASVPVISSGGLPSAVCSMLQQAQANTSHCQQEHQLPPVIATISQLELSALNGIFRNMVTMDNRVDSKICKFCLFLRERNFGPPPFHWCVDDAITKGFRGPSPAGPIGRPGKRHVEAAA